MWWGAAWLLIASGCGRIGFDPGGPNGDGGLPGTGDGGPIPALAGCEPSTTLDYVVSPTGDDAQDGSPAHPWRTLLHAYETAADGSTIVVDPGTYNESVPMSRTLTTGVTLRSRDRYRAVWRTDDVAVHCLGCIGLTIEGFEIVGAPTATAGPLIHVQAANAITFRDNIIHGRQSSALVRINDDSFDVRLERDVMYDAGAYVVHLASTSTVTLEDSIMFHGGAGDGQLLWIESQDTSPDDGHRIRRNVFLDFRGSGDVSLLDIAGAGGAVIENNLVIGNGSGDAIGIVRMTSDETTTLRNNTIVGAFASSPFGVHFDAVMGKSTGLTIANNVWLATDGMMGQFSDGTATNVDTAMFGARSNAYWNAGQPIDDTATLLGPHHDPGAVTLDPGLVVVPIVPPTWNGTAFADGSTTVCEAFARIVVATATTAPGSPLVGAGDATVAAADDIFGRPRHGPSTIGAWQP